MPSLPDKDFPLRQELFKRKSLRKMVLAVRIGLTTSALPRTWSTPWLDEPKSGKQLLNCSSATPTNQLRLNELSIKWGRRLQAAGLRSQQDVIRRPLPRHPNERLFTTISARKRTGRFPSHSGHSANAHTRTLRYRRTSSRHRHYPGLAKIGFSWRFCRCIHAAGRPRPPDHQGGVIVHCWCTVASIGHGRCQQRRAIYVCD